MAIVYFILWVVFIVAVIAAVPIVNALEKKRRREAMPQQPVEEPVETAEFEQTESEGFGDEMPEETAEVAGGDDFSAFDEEFK